MNSSFSVFILTLFSVVFLYQGKMTIITGPTKPNISESFSADVNFRETYRNQPQLLSGMFYFDYQDKRQKVSLSDTTQQFVRFYKNHTEYQVLTNGTCQQQFF